MERAQITRHSQCLWYALGQWHAHGGYLVLGKSKHWLIPHVLHMSSADGHHLTHFVPPGPLSAPWYSLFGFAGSIVTDDPVARAPMSKTGMLLGTLILFVFGGVWAVTDTLQRITKKGPHE